MGRLILLGFALCLAGCSGDGDGDADDDVATCGPDRFVISGTLDGETVSHSGELGGHGWIQSSAGSSLDTPFEGGGSFHAEWQEVVADGETFTANGSINLPPSGPRGGETLEYASGTLTKRDDGVTFTLNGLTASVQCIAAPCPNSTVQGSLRGCVEWAPFMP
ncbi:MAG TPA: hypothetical protein VEX18_10360 [Polyangiaceae bacterium]|nr:hypothetical protein [Polyangiaceae bacterium]